MERLTSGTELVDTLIDGMRIGDNLVVQGDASAPLELLVARFVAHHGSRQPLAVVTLVPERLHALPGAATILDWSPVRSGEPSVHERAVAPDATFEAALASLHDVEADVGPGAAFVFDGLADVQAAWGADAALELFLSACPRLYRQRSLALWPLETAHHRPAFLRRLEEITQVVVEFADDDGQLEATVRKADGRSSGVVGRCVHAAVVDGDLHALDAPTSSRERLGTVIRTQRLAHGLSQAEVARRVGITPSALSQVERGVRGPSGDTLVRLWEVLGVPFGPADPADPGYRVARRSGRDRVRLQDGLVGEQVADDPVTGELWQLEAAPGASGTPAPFAVKAPEVVTVVRGVLDLQVDGHAETLHEGDALTASDATITGWANPATVPTEILWAIHRK